MSEIGFHNENEIWTCSNLKLSHVAEWISEKKKEISREDHSYQYEESNNKNIQEEETFFQVE